MNVWMTRHPAPRFERLLSRFVGSFGLHLFSGDVRNGEYFETYTGPGLEVLLGGSPDDQTASEEVWSLRVVGEDVGRYRDAMDRLHAGEAVDVEYRLLGLDGRCRWIRECGLPRTAGRRLIVDGFALDVTAQKEVEIRLRVALHELELARAHAEMESRTDLLTRLPNRRHLAEVLDGELDRAARTGASGGFLLLDVDHFKRINDTFGHAAGDAVLVEVANRLRATVRKYDSLARWGGEEFAVVAPHLSDERALRGCAERLQVAVTRTPFRVADDAITITASVGATIVRAGDLEEAVLRRADQALYRAKHGGRNRVMVATNHAIDGSAIVGVVGENVTAHALALAAVVRERVPEAHADQVCDLATKTARELGSTRAEVARCHLVGLLHDVGKIAIPDAILFKPCALTPRELELMQRHPEIGAALIEHVPDLAAAAAGVRHHHERFDGTGYPDRLAGEAIPIEARVVAAADVYSAMTTDRVYSDARSRQSALRELRRAAGTQLDPAVVDALCRVLERDLRHTKKRLDATSA